MVTIYNYAVTMQRDCAVTLLVTIQSHSQQNKNILNLKICLVRIFNIKKTILFFYVFFLEYIKITK